MNLFRMVQFYGGPPHFVTLLRLEVFLCSLCFDSRHALGHSGAGSADGICHVKVLQQFGGHVQGGLGVQRFGRLLCGGGKLSSLRQIISITTTQKE